MTDSIIHQLVDILRGGGKELAVFIISMMPILELRGGLIASALLKMQFLPAFIICFIGNILPIPIVLIFINKVFNWIKRWPKVSKMIDKLEKRSLSKADQIKKYEFWGLVIFVGIPLPGTGAWTGALIASVLNMDKKKAFLAITLGVLIAGIIMSILSFGILDKIL
jgi:uncharacterized membrane protein